MNKDMNNILKQTIAGMRQQPLITALTIIGTALAICLIMIVMMTREVQIADYGAEPNRSRTLYVKTIHIAKSEGYDNYTTGMYSDMAREIFLKMKTPEAVATISANEDKQNVSTPDGDVMPLRVKAVNDGFFKIFALDFTEGKPFTKEECASDLPIAILSRSTCRALFSQETGVKGKTFLIENHEYKVAGVAENVSKLLTHSTADIWVPMSSYPAEHPLKSSLYPYSGVSVAMLAKDKGDFTRIRHEVERNLAAYNKTSKDTLDFVGAPDVQEVDVNRFWSNIPPDLEEIHLHYLLVFVILLIVPAINIASMTQSRLRQREAEIGVRRAFGAKRSTILLQTMMESLLQTLMAGVIGLAFCIAFCYFLADYIFEAGLFEREYGLTLDLGILFSPAIYGWALLFCLVLNILSSTIPAWKASRCNIVEALK